MRRYDGRVPKHSNVMMIADLVILSGFDAFDQIIMEGFETVSQCLGSGDRSLGIPTEVDGEGRVITVVCVE